MQNSYYQSNHNSQSLFYHFVPAGEIYTELLQKTCSKKDFKLSSMIKNLHVILKEKPWIPCLYFEKYYERFIYETILCLYSQIYILQETGKLEASSIRKCIKIYYPDFNKTNLNSESSKLSRKSSDISSDFEYRKFNCTYQKKAALYFSVLGNNPFTPSEEIPDEAIPVWSPIYLTPQNRIFNLKSYSDIIYSEKNAIRGVPITNFYKMAEQFLSLHKPDTLKDELSIYQFEYIHYPIQYLRCYSTYLNRFKKYNKSFDDYLPLWLYIHLFDTHFPSLTDYLLEKYDTILDHLYVEPNAFKPVYYERQFLNGFWIPIIQECFIGALYYILNYDINAIKEYCQTYFYEKPFGIYRYNYQTLLNNAIQQIKTVTFLDHKELNNPDNAKNDSVNYHFNLAFSKSFFLQDLPNYFENCSSANFSHVSIDNFIALTAIDFSKNCNDYSNLAIKTCPPYKESVLSRFQ